MAVMTEAEVLGLFDSCSNIGRWGPDDERGTLNHIRDEDRVAAAALVRTGHVVALGRDLSRRTSAKNPIPVVQRMLFDGAHEEVISSIDQIEIAPHGWETTHLDGTGHIFHQGRMWNGRPARDFLTFEGMTFGSVYAHRDGIVTRGVLLDIPRARGLDCVPATEGIHLEHIEAAERLTGTQVRSGDAILVRGGIDVWEAAHGETAPALMTGVEPDCLPWMFERQIALYAGDCADRGPSGYPSLPVPIHQVGMVAMGLCIVDNVQVETLAAHCAATGVYEFQLIVAPIRAPGATGVAVNPLAIF
jgi:hypothetical protein